MSKLPLLLLLAFAALACANLRANEGSPIGGVAVGHGKYSDYYHIKYTLTDSNFDTTRDGSEYVIDNGQFEIYLHKADFPIPAPNCKGKLILRMPATLSDDKNYKESIGRKLQLYDEIKKVHDKKLKSLNVIIELNPYVKVKSKRPLLLELEQCNIFFRTKNNEYVDTLD